MLRFAKVYVDEIKQQQKREWVFLWCWMDVAVGGQRGRSDSEGWTKVFKILTQTEYMCVRKYRVHSPYSVPYGTP